MNPEPGDIPVKHEVLGKSDSVITPKGSLFVEIIAWFVIVVT